MHHGRTNTNDQLIKANEKHRHLPSPEHVELRNLTNKVTDRIESEMISVLKVYKEELARSNLSSVAPMHAPNSC